MVELGRTGAGAVVAALGGGAIAVPVFDMADDVAAGDPWLSTVVENVAQLGLGVAIVGLAVWLVAADWEAKQLWTVARISVLFTLGVAGLMALVLLIQERVQGELKPFVIAADAVVIGALGGVLLGIRTAQQERATADAAAQRDRFQALFDNVPNPIVGVEFVGDVPVVRAVNPAFTEVFGFDRRTIVDEDLRQYIVPPDQNLDPVDGPIAEREMNDGEAWDSNVVELETVDGRREFIRLTAPVDRGPKRDGYAVYIDVTAERQRRERLRVLSRTLRHDIRNKLTVVRGVETVTDELEGRDRRRAELAAGAAEDLLSTAERTRRVERQVAGESQPQPRDLTGIVTEAVSRVRSTHPDAEISLELPDEGYADVTGAFVDAVEAIVSNGVVHNDTPRPRVEVAVTESLDGEYVDVRVADDGPGIDPEEADIARGSLTPDQKTTHLDGVGLWMARWVTQNCGGELRFSSNSPRGTVATLRVPRADPDETEDGSDDDSAGPRATSPGGERVSDGRDTAPDGPGGSDGPGRAT